MPRRQWPSDQEIMETSASDATLRRYVRLPGAVDEAILMLDYGAGSAPAEVAPAGAFFAFRHAIGHP